MTTTTRSPLKWHGGKSYLATRIVGLFPSDAVAYVEPYFGAGHVLFAKDPSGWAEVVNDLNGELTTFWRVLQDIEAFDRFARVIEAVPFSEAEWRDSLNVESTADQVDRAVRFFIRFRQSRQGLGRDFATLSRNRTRRAMNEQANAWLSVVDGLADAHARLRRVVILNRPAIDVIRQQDGAKTVFYLDPPYLPDTRTSRDEYGEFEMTVDDHAELLQTLADISGRFILSGYSSRLYDRFAAERGWRRLDVQIDNKASGARSKPRKVESLWMNY
jgi:DNA adenine methylase